MLAVVSPIVVAHLCFVPTAFVFVLRAGDAMWNEALFSNAFHSVAAFAAWVLVCSVAYVAVAVSKRALERAMDDHGVHFDRCREVTALMVSVCVADVQSDARFVLQTVCAGAFLWWVWRRSAPWSRVMHGLVRCACRLVAVIARVSFYVASSPSRDADECVFASAESDRKELESVKRPAH